MNWSSLKNILFLVLYSLIQIGCTDSGSIKINLDEGEQVVHLKSNKNLVSNCELKLVGHHDCDLKLSVTSENSSYIDKGKIEFERKYEWYNASKKITITTDSCIGEGDLTLNYHFRSGYYGNK